MGHAKVGHGINLTDGHLRVAIIIHRPAVIKITRYTGGSRCDLYSRTYDTSSTPSPPTKVLHPA